MSKIDTLNWKEFELQDIFEKQECKKLSYKATDLEKIATEKADLPALTAGIENQGLSVYVPRDGATILKNCISVSANGANSGAMFYQPNDFTVLQDSYAIKCKYEQGCSESISLYMIGVLNKIIRINYDWKEKAGWNKIKSKKIKLPSTVLGEPDWLYMEKYMKNIETRVCNSLLKLELTKDILKTKINVSNWGDFIVGELFDVKRPSARSQSDYGTGDVPFVASGNYNNGIIKYCEPKKDEVLDEGNCITVSPLDGSSFYQRDAFLGRGGAGSAIILLYNNNLNLFRGLFISSAIRNQLTKYSYNNQLSSSIIIKEKIKLPITPKGTPDWEYMENYMQQVEERVQNILYCMKNGVI